MKDNQNQPESNENDIKYVNLYETDNKIYTRKIKGFYQALRRYTGIPLVLGFLLLPWINLGGRQAVWFDLPERQFHILSVTFWPQDFMLLAWLLIIAAFLLFTVTVLLGRVWCGFTCPQTVWTLVYIAVEHFFEGDRNKRIKLDSQPWGAEKVLRKGAKHAVWLLIAFITGLTFIGYFVPIKELSVGLIPYYDSDYGMLTLDAHPAAVFWVLFFTVITYLNAGWLREQVCKFMCPYARFQSVMYDEDTLAVHYDATRGESRGPRKATQDYKAQGLGDCIDCSWCVQVCPVDIDIRDGLQYECINCGLCVDACNQVMDKMDYPRGLIRFTSDDELKTGKTRFIRPRLFGYLAGVIIMMGAFTTALWLRQPLSVDVLRDRSTQMYRIVKGNVRNVYTVKINNMSETPHTYRINVSGDAPYELKRYRSIVVNSGEVFSIPVQVMVKKDALPSAKNTIIFTVQSKDDSEVTATETSSFIGPDKK